MTEAQAMPLHVVRTRLDELVEMWHVHGVEEIAMLRREGEIVGLSVFGLVAHGHTLARAVRLLDAAGEGAQIVPLVRQLLECSVTAMWVQAYGLRAAYKIQREEARARVAVFRQYMESGLLDDGSVARWEAEQKRIDPFTTRASEKFHQRSEELDVGGGAYSTFRALSALSHASGTVIDLYCEEEPAGGGPNRLVLAAHPKEWAREAVLGFALIYLLYAGMAWDKCEKDHPRRTRLKQIAAEMGVRLAWNQTATGQSRQLEWEREQRPQRRGHGERSQGEAPSSS